MLPTLRSQRKTTSPLISPEGWLINLVEIEDAEKGRLAEPPWCFVKTQFGPVEGHVALVEMLTALQMLRGLAQALGGAGISSPFPACRWFN